MDDALIQDVETHRLDNRLRLVLQPDKSLPLVATHVSYHVGSAQDPPGQSGLSHLFEHLFFLGSQHVGPQGFFYHLRQAGGQANGATWYDRTTYFQTLPSEHLELALWLESDRLGFFTAVLDPAVLEVQRNVVLSERRQRFDNQPYGRVHEHIHELLFPPGHPYRRPVIGSPEDLRAITVEDVTAFFDAQYTPANAVLCLVGDFEPGPTRELVNTYFAPLPRRRPPKRPDASEPTPHQSNVRRVISESAGLSRIYMGFRLPAYGTDDWYAADLLSSALTAGRSSRLHENLVRNRQLAQDVSSFVLPTQLGATFTLAVTCRSQVEPERVEEAMRQTFKQIAAGDLSPDQLQQARDRLQTQHYRSLQTLEKRADALAKAELYFDDPGALSRELARYGDLDLDQVVQTTATYLHPDLGVTLTYVAGSRSEEAQP